MASVGLSESKADEQGLKFHVKHEMTSGWYQSRRVAEAYSGYKVPVEEESGKILGAHLFGSGAEEVINLFAVAMRSGMRASDLKHMLLAYPKHGSDVPCMLWFAKRFTYGIHWPHVLITSTIFLKSSP